MRSLRLICGLAWVACVLAAQPLSDARTTLARAVRALNDQDWRTLEALVEKDADVRLPTSAGGLIFPLTRGPANPANAPNPWPRYSLLIRRSRATGDEMLLDGAWSRIDPDTHLPGVEGSFVAAVRGGALRYLRMFPSGAAPAEAYTTPGAAPAPGGGWITVFDGRTTAGWVASGGGPFPAIWTVEDGCLKTLPPNRPGPRYSIQTTRWFVDFEFEFEWKLAAGANSGAKYRVLVSRQYPSGAYDVASEYQLADDAGDPGARVDPKQRSGALYSILAPARGATRPAGEWNRSRIVVRGRQVEHWLNGEKVLEYECDEPIASPLVLQHHVTEARFRNLRVRPLNTP